ncbi:MAG TPA: polysaccharide deacetylase family protein [Gaiellaceae bacterium]|nr:polysaccharide deacetylase family protein [Gaiellaceae bacterium]
MSKRGLRETIVGLVMIPLSVVPIWLYVTRTSDGYLMYLRARYALAPPSTPRLSHEEYRIARAARRQREVGVAVLLYHGIGRTSTDGGGSQFVISRTRFAEQMRALDAAGYRPITCHMLAAYLRTGQRGNLPRKPILITFDDGRLDAMLQADQILRDTHLRATMFVIAKRADEGALYYATSGELRGYVRSGRWEIENHTYDLHSAQQVGRFSHSALATPHAGETLSHYGRRISRDLDRAQRSLGSPIAFAYPFGDWGEQAPAGAAQVLRSVLRKRFLLAFDQDGQSSWRSAVPGDDRLRIHRLEVSDWTPEALLARLRAGSRRAAAVLRH